MLDNSQKQDFLDPNWFLTISLLIWGILWDFLRIFWIVCTFLDFFGIFVWMLSFVHLTRNQMIRHLIPFLKYKCTGVCGNGTNFWRNRCMIPVLLHLNSQEWIWVTNHLVTYPFAPSMIMKTHTIQLLDEGSLPSDIVLIVQPHAYL